MNITRFTPCDLGPQYTTAKGRDHEIVRDLESHQVQCKDICGLALNRMSRNKSRPVRIQSVMVSQFLCWSHLKEVGLRQYAGDHRTLERKKDDSDVATGVNYGVTSFSSWAKSIYNPKMGITRIRGL